MSTYYIEAGEIDNKPAFLIVRADDAHVIGYQRSWHEAEEFMATKADPPGTELTMCADGWRYGLIAPGDRHPESWSKAFASHEECLRYARECASVPSGSYSAWVSDSEGNRLYTTSGHATRQEALEQAWKRYPSARTVASGKGAYGWEDVQFQSAVARRIETGAPEPTGEAPGPEQAKTARETLSDFRIFAHSTYGPSRDGWPRVTRQIEDQLVGKALAEVDPLREARP